MRFGKSDKIQFISMAEGLESVEKTLPRPAKHFIPKWFKDISSKEIGTVKDCPSFPDYFSQGYIIPMWVDVVLDKKENEVKWEASTNFFNWEFHGNDQFIDHIKPSFNGIEGQFVFKALCPWRIITPPGWSVLQLPLYYHFNQEWSVMPGVIDTDVHHEINQQVMYHGNGNPVRINSGDPFVLYLPFKRSSKLKHEIFYQNEKIKKYFNMADLRLSKSFRPNGIYRELQRKRDKKD